MIDLRCHVLDGSPCGPESFAKSVEMCHSAQANGVSLVVATLRWEAGRAEPPLPFEECRSKLDRLESELSGALSLRLGFAFRFSSQLPALVERYGSRLALGGKRHLLVSMPALNIPAEAEEVWDALGRAGFSVVIAHPECSPALRREPERLVKWVGRGFFLQIDVASVSGVYGREVRRFALSCLRDHGGSTVLATNWSGPGRDGHSLARAKAEVAKQVGERSAATCVYGTPSLIIGDKPEEVPAADRSPLSNLKSFYRAFKPHKTQPDTP